jgi:hypothetical protein
MQTVLLYTEEKDKAANEIQLFGGKITQVFSDQLFVAIIPETSNLLKWSTLHPSYPINCLKFPRWHWMHGCLSPLNGWTKIVNQFSHSKFRNHVKTKKTIQSGGKVQYSSGG